MSRIAPLVAFLDLNGLCETLVVGRWLWTATGPGIFGRKGSDARLTSFGVRGSRVLELMNEAAQVVLQVSMDLFKLARSPSQFGATFGLGPGHRI